TGRRRGNRGHRGGGGVRWRGGCRGARPGGGVATQCRRARGQIREGRRIGGEGRRRGWHLLERRVRWLVQEGFFLEEEHDDEVRIVVGRRQQVQRRRIEWRGLEEVEPAEEADCEDQGELIPSHGRAHRTTARVHV